MFQNVVKYTYKTSLMTCSCLCAASFAAQASEMQCLNVNCESLGYTKVTDLENTSCKSFLTCPYDPSYIKCDLLPTCENLGFTNDDKSDWCTNLVRCPTDPSYTLCKSLCGECPVGTALDPAELGCEGAYEAAYIKRTPRGGKPQKRYITNDCGYTCYQCSECDDEEYEAAEELCSAGTYITEVIHPKCPSNAGKGDRYICSDCPDGLINLGVNNYDCTVLDDEGNPVAGCDGINFFNSLAECQSAKGECAEHPTAFGICYASSALCGEGALSEYKYSFEGQPLALAGHEWFSKIDSTKKVCYKTTCLTEADDGVLAAFATEAICKENHTHSNSKGVICKSDGYSCYVFDTCNDGYKISTGGATGYSTSCVCETGSYDTPEKACNTVNGSLGSSGSCDTTSTLYDVLNKNGCYYLEFSSCNDPYADINDDETCLCDSDAGYYDTPEKACTPIPGASFDDERSTCITTSTIYDVVQKNDCYIAQFDDCNTGYDPDTNGNCVKKTCAKINEYYRAVSKSDLMNRTIMRIIEQYYVATAYTGSDGKCYDQKTCQELDSSYLEDMNADTDCSNNAYVCTKATGITLLGIDNTLTHHGKICYTKSCNTADGYYEVNGECALKICDTKTYPYTQAPENGSLVEPKCTDSQGTHYSDRACNVAVSGYSPLTLENNQCILSVAGTSSEFNAFVLSNRKLEEYGFSYSNVTSVSYYIADTNTFLDERDIRTWGGSLLSNVDPNYVSAYSYTYCDTENNETYYAVLKTTDGKEYRTNAVYVPKAENNLYCQDHHVLTGGSASDAFFPK